MESIFQATFVILKIIEIGHLHLENEVNPNIAHLKRILEMKKDLK